eukprot:TRINITY_DN59911_c0_g1_i1.p1 TRINITY_DN59911_c0_g1~~TRINITY_DN59911_c0_g1_i1.p1  ORF type:complete len:446 (-),score=25.15 TRINITY_DN59911_c0_g1_i1:275-1612(-)
MTEPTDLQTEVAAQIKEIHVVKRRMIVHTALVSASGLVLLVLSILWLLDVLGNKSIDTTCVNVNPSTSLNRSGCRRSSRSRCRVRCHGTAMFKNTKINSAPIRIEGPTQTWEAAAALCSKWFNISNTTTLPVESFEWGNITDNPKFDEERVKQAPSQHEKDTASIVCTYNPKNTELARVGRSGGNVKHWSTVVTGASLCVLSSLVVVVGVCVFPVHRMLKYVRHYDMEFIAAVYQAPPRPNQENRNKDQLVEMIAPHLGESSVRYIQEAKMQQRSIVVSMSTPSYVVLGIFCCWCLIEIGMITTAWLRWHKMGSYGTGTGALAVVAAIGTLLYLNQVARICAVTPKGILSIEGKDSRRLLPCRSVPWTNKKRICQALGVRTDGKRDFLHVTPFHDALFGVATNYNPDCVPPPANAKNQNQQQPQYPRNPGAQSIYTPEDDPFMPV